MSAARTVMHARCSVFVATSLDGFIARADGSIDWLDEANLRVPAGEDCGYSAFMATVDALVIGRATFEQALAFESWPYGLTPVYVLSRTLRQLPPKAPDTVILTSSTPNEIAALAWARGQRSLYVDGGKLSRAFSRPG